MKNKYILLFLILTIITSLYYTSQGRAEDSHPALNTPHLFAWKIFIGINHPANLQQTGMPDVSKKIGDPGRVVWETWATAKDVYKDPHKAPVWPQFSSSFRKLEEFEEEPLQQIIVSGNQKLSSEEQEDAEWENWQETPKFPEEGSEVKLNFATFQHIVENELYNIEGQEKFFETRKKIEFPVESQEVKAHWKKISQQDRERYHTSLVVLPDGRHELWGLIALHISTKDLPKWFWATFEHQDNSGREGVIASVDDYGLPEQLRGSKWENYVLRGVQTDFVDSIGRPTILANSQIERGFQATSSCISCHARAAIGPKPRKIVPDAGFSSDQDPDDVKRIPVFESLNPVKGSIGIPKYEWFVDMNTWPPARKFIQTDFVWSVIRARRKYPMWPRPEMEPVTYENEASEYSEEELYPDEFDDSEEAEDAEYYDESEESDPDSEESDSDSDESDPEDDDKDE